MYLQGLQWPGVVPPPGFSSSRREKEGWRDGGRERRGVVICIKHFTFNGNSKCCTEVQKTRRWKINWTTLNQQKKNRDDKTKVKVQCKCNAVSVKGAGELLFILDR